LVEKIWPSVRSPTDWLNTESDFEVKGDWSDACDGTGPKSAAIASPAAAPHSAGDVTVGLLLVRWSAK